MVGAVGCSREGQTLLLLSDLVDGCSEGGVVFLRVETAVGGCSQGGGDDSDMEDMCVCAMRHKDCGVDMSVAVRNSASLCNSKLVCRKVLKGCCWAAVGVGGWFGGRVFGV